MPPLLALFAGMAFAFAVHMQSKGLDYMGDRKGAFISLLAMALVFWIISPAFADWSLLGTQAALVFAVCGLFFPAFSQRLAVIAVDRLGPAVAGSVGSFAPLFAAIPAILFLGETLTWNIALGMSLMVAGVLVSARSSKSAPRAWPVWLLLLPIGASFLRGIVQPITKAWMDSIQAAFMSTLIMSSVSALVAGAILLTARKPKADLDTRAGTFWFAANGIVTGLGIMALQAAISMGDVVVVAPLTSAVPLWTLLLGWLVFKREVLGLRQFIMATLIVFGTILIVIR